VVRSADSLPVYGDRHRAVVGTSWILRSGRRTAAPATA
jgi:hypothetical protein